MFNIIDINIDKKSPQKRKFRDIINIKELLEYLNNPFDNKQWSYAYHYTNLYNLFQIYNNKSLRLSQMIKMNDVFEFKFAQGCKNYYFCLTKGRKDNKENFGMWAMYGQIRNKKTDKENIIDYAKQIGVKIEFSRETLKKIVNLNTNLKFHFVAYTNLINNEKQMKIKCGSTSTKEKIEINESLYGYLKDNSWEYEKEMRFCLPSGLDSQDKSYNDIYLDNNILNELNVLPSPRYSSQECKDVFKQLSKDKNISEPSFNENIYFSTFQE